MEGPLEVSRRWVVTPMFFSKKTKHIGEGEMLDREILAFEGSERHCRHLLCVTVKESIGTFLPLKLLKT